MKTCSSFAFLLTLAAVSWAQNPRPGAHRGTEDAGPRFLGAEAGVPRRVVTGAPFSGDLVTESTRTLADGNRIRQSSAAHLVRDSAGRTRREVSLAGLSALAAGGAGQQVVFIVDPVAGASYALDPVRKTASKSPWAGPAGGGARSSAAPGARRDRREEGSEPAKVEPLGAATIEGLRTEGTRTTVTIAAGAIGNAAPIQVVTERWYSADLRMPVVIKRSDPRSGETVTRLVHVTRSEPSPTLLQVPSDFKLIERPAPRFRPPVGAAP